MPKEISCLRPSLTITVCLLLSPLAAADGRPCDAGRRAALQGDESSAITKWETISRDSTAKEQLRAVMTCLRNSGIASSDEDAANWLIKVASNSKGRALLYAGMLYAAGAGVPQDLDLARQYLQKARDLHVNQADDMLRILDLESSRKKD